MTDSELIARLETAFAMGRPAPYPYSGCWMWYDRTRMWHNGEAKPPCMRPAATFREALQRWLEQYEPAKPKTAAAGVAATPALNNKQPTPQTP